MNAIFDDTWWSPGVSVLCKREHNKRDGWCDTGWFSYVSTQQGTLGKE